MNRLTHQHRFGVKGHILHRTRRWGRLLDSLWTTSEQPTQRAYQAHFVAIEGEKCDFMA
ncbi:MAG: hypothetical protein J6R31_05985 [Rikenellaceae bacterium]|nr:hypothetical protein [Rikenellaceae bacterium]